MIKKKNDDGMLSNDWFDEERQLGIQVKRSGRVRPLRTVATGPSPADSKGHVFSSNMGATVFHSIFLGFFFF